MVKPLNIHASYNKQKRIIECQPDEIKNKIESVFNIRINDVIMYAVKNGKRVQVSEADITDVMNIQIVQKKNGQKSPCNFQDVDSASKEIVDNMIFKLTHNTQLTGKERKLLISALEEHSTSIFKKRKLDQTDFDRPPVFHRKVQVNIPAQNIKESFAQTDPFKIVQNNENKEEDAIVTLKRLWKDGKSNEQIESLMKETFHERRNFICIKCPPVIRIKEEYPALFCVDQVKSELDRIFYPGKCSDFLKNMKKYSKYILYYQADDSDKIHEKVKKALESALTPAQETYAAVVGSVFVLTKLLEEDFRFIRLSDYPLRSDDGYPYIDATCYSLEKIFFEDEKKSLGIMVEEQHLCDASNFPEAILCLMASFFIFNINYPKNCCRTFTVFEKLFLGTNDAINMDYETEKIIEQLKEDQAKKKKPLKSDVQ